MSGNHAGKYAGIYASKYASIPFILAGLSFPISVILFVLVDIFGIKSVVLFAYVALALYNLGGLGCISSLSDGLKGNAIIRWISTLGYLGFSVGLVDSVRTLTFGSGIITWPESLQPILKRVDPLGVIHFPAVGVWIIAVCISGMQRFPKWLNVVGIICGVLLFLPPISESMSMLGLDFTFLGWLAPLAVLASAIWFVGMGIHIARSPDR